MTAGLGTSFCLSNSFETEPTCLTCFLPVTMNVVESPQRRVLLGSADRR
jgi:hypothetical protein